MKKNAEKYASFPLDTARVFLYTDANTGKGDGTQAFLGSFHFGIFPTGTGLSEVVSQERFFASLPVFAPHRFDHIYRTLIIEYTQGDHAFHG